MNEILLNIYTCVVSSKKKHVSYSDEGVIPC